MKDHAVPFNRRALLLNAGVNGLAFLAQLAVAFFLAPLLVRHLGRERYGVWSFIEGFLAYFTLFDLGIAATLVRYVPKCRAAGDAGLLDRVVSACLFVFSLAGLVVILLGVVVFSILLFTSAKIPAELRTEAAGLAAISLLCLAATLPLSVYPAILDGLNRFSTKAMVRTLFLAARVGGTLAVVYFRLGLVSLAAVFALCTVLEHLVMSWLVERLLPELRAAPWRVDRATLKLIRGYSFDSFLAMLAGRVAFKTDAIVIGLAGHLDLIPFFDMPSRLVEYAKNLIRSGTTTLTPAISALEAKGGTVKIRELFLNGCRYAMYLALPIQLALVLFGGAFLELWLKDAAYRVQGQPVLWALAAALGLAMMQSVAARVLYGVGKIRWFARLMLLEAGLNLGLSLALVGPLGIIGVALGTAIPNMAMSLVILIQVCRMLEVDASELWRQSLLRPMVGVLGLLPLWLGLAHVLPPTGRLSFAALVSVGVLLFAGLAALLEGGKLPQRWRARGGAWLLRVGK
ncbi:MAG: polysaccharide biosynthesis C-terminal domain-containing protein [Gemmataceae bacterium]